jgi:hypothetical protein
VPVARRLLDTTDRAFKLVVSDSWLVGLFRTKVLARIAALAMSLKRVQALAFRVVSQTGIHYRDSAVSQTLDGVPADAPRAGDRFPWLRLRFEVGGTSEDSFARLDDRHFHLVVIGQPAPAVGLPGLAGLLRIHAIPADAGNEAELTRARIAQPSFYLVRPDGYVGLCGAQLEAAAVTKYVTEHLLFRAGSADLGTLDIAPRPNGDWRGSPPSRDDGHAT